MYTSHKSICTALSSIKNQLMTEYLQVRPKHCPLCTKSCLCLSALLLLHSSLYLKAQTVARMSSRFLALLFHPLLSHSQIPFSTLCLSLSLSLSHILFSLFVFCFFPMSFSCFFHLSLSLLFPFSSCLPLPVFHSPSSFLFPPSHLASLLFLSFP